MSIQTSSSQIIKSFTGVSTDQLEEAFLNVLKHPAMIRDMTTVYLSWQKIAEIGGIPVIYQPIGSSADIDFQKQISKINGTRVNQGKFMYEISLVDATVSTDSAEYASGQKWYPQTLFLRFENFGEPVPYQWSVNTAQSDKGHVSHKVLSQVMPPVLRLQYGHMLTDETTGATTYYDFNTRLERSGNPQYDVFTNQQVNILTLRFAVNVVHLF